MSTIAGIAMTVFRSPPSAWGVAKSSSQLSSSQGSECSASPDCSAAHALQVRLRLTAISIPGQGRRSARKRIS
ncbi:hypothetical protein D3C84_393780 [compost metagenome]